MALKSDNCAVGFKDNSSANCEFNPELVVGHLVSLNLSKKLEISTLNKASIQAELAARTLYLVKGYVDAPENDVTSLTTSKTGYGNTIVTGNKMDVNITYNLPYSACQYRELKSWSEVKVTAWPIDANGRIGGTLVEEGGTFYSRGQVSRFIVPKSLPMKFNINDIVVSGFTWLADDVEIDTWDSMNVDLEELDGVVTLNGKVTASSTTEVTISLTAGCNGTGIAGLAGDLVVKGSGGSPVATTWVDNGDGTYTGSGTYSAGTYSVNLASDVYAVGDNLYSKLATALTFTTV